MKHIALNMVVVIVNSKVVFRMLKVQHKIGELLGTKRIDCNLEVGHNSKVTGH